MAWDVPVCASMQEEGILCEYKCLPCFSSATASDICCRLGWAGKASSRSLFWGSAAPDMEEEKKEMDIHVV